MPELGRLLEASACASLGTGRGGLLGRRRLGLPGLGGPRHARAPTACGRHRRVAVAGRRRAGRLRGPGRASGACAGSDGGRPTSSTTPAYVANDGDRCYHCKSALMDALAPLAEPSGATVVLGVNVDDLGDHRPGQRAAAERGAVFPLVDAGFTKADVRAWSQRLGLRTWDKPAAACLASRRALRHAGDGGGAVAGGAGRGGAAARSASAALRVRHYGDTARIEVPIGELAAVLERREAVVAAVQAAGYRYVTLDLEGLRSGNLNAALRAN